MKFASSFAVAFALVAIALAAPQGHPEVVVVKENPSDNIGTADGFNFGYELSNGHSRQESAQLKNAGSEHEALAVRGSYSWVDLDTNQKFTVTYVADENGFQPQGAHIPA